MIIAWPGAYKVSNVQVGVNSGVTVVYSVEQG